MKIKIIAEIGINHNGSLEIAKKLIDTAIISGCDYVKFQKRNPDICVPDQQKLKLKATPWGEMPYIDYKHKIEFGKEQFDEIDRYCSKRGMKWFASVWDLDSVEFMADYSDMTKIPSAHLTNYELLNYAREKNNLMMLSTGMSREEDIEKSIKIGNPDVIFHTNSTYPCPVEELNLNYINSLKSKYPNKAIGYSGHEYGLVTTFAAVALGVEYVERHVTLDRTLWGSDQIASIEPAGVMKLVKGIRDIEKAFGDPGPRKILGGELEKLKSLRG